MKIVGSGNKVIDADLLARLATDRASGSAVSATEMQKAIKSVRADLKDQFETSTRGLDRAALAVSNTLDLAIKSGWVKSGDSTRAVNDFLKGTDEGSLKDTLKDIRADVKSYQGGGTSYGGRVSTPRTNPRPTGRSYGGGTRTRVGT